MAGVVKTHSDLQPVFAFDTQNGPIAGATSLAGLPVQPAGPKLDFFTLTANASVNTAGNTSGYLTSVVNAVQQLATIAMYQVDGTNISLAIFPTGTYTTTTLLAAANVTSTTYQLNSLFVQVHERRPW